MGASQVGAPLYPCPLVIHNQLFTQRRGRKRSRLYISVLYYRVFICHKDDYYFKNITRHSNIFCVYRRVPVVENNGIIPLHSLVWACDVKEIINIAMWVTMILYMLISILLTHQFCWNQTHASEAIYR